MKWNYGNIQENEVSSDFFILTDHCSGVCLKCRRSKFNLSVRKILWRGKWQPTPVFLPGKSHGQRSLVGYDSWGHKRVGHNLATKQQLLEMAWSELSLRFQVWVIWWMLKSLSFKQGGKAHSIVCKICLEKQWNVAVR